MRIEWIHGNNQILLWNEFRAALFDLRGQKLNEIDLGQESTDDYPFRCWAVHPTGKYATVVCTDGNIRNWDFQDSKLSKFAETPWLEVGINGAFLKWNPSGNRLAVHTLAFENENVHQCHHFQLFNEQGKELVTNPNVAPPFAWSPDGKFLTSSEGNTYDLDLNEIRKVNLPRTHSPFWHSPNEIIGVRVEYGLPVSLCKLSPNGDLQELTGPVQPLIPMGASWTNSGEISAFFRTPENSSPLFKWKSDGQGKHVESTSEVDLAALQQLHRPYEISWSHTDDRIALPIGPNHVLILDSNGNVQARVPVQPNASRFSISRDGQRLAYFAPSANDVSGQQGMVFIQNLKSRETEKEFDVYSPPYTLEWSPDGKWLAGNVNDSTGKPLCVIWGVESDITQGFELNRSTEVHLAFSPNGRFIAIGDGNGKQPDASDGRRIRLVNLTNWNESLLELDIPVLTRYYPVWSPDSKRLFSGCLCAVSEKGELSRIGNAEMVHTEFATFSPDGEALVFGVVTSEGKNQQGLHRVGANGNLAGTLPFQENLTQLWFASQPHNRPLPKISSGSKRIALASSPEITSLACLDAQTKSVLWNGLAFADGETVTLSANGSIIDGPTEIDRYLIHVIRYPGGRVVPLSNREYSRRTDSSPAERALYWALDHGAIINGENGSQILQQFDANGKPGLRPEDVESLELLNCKELVSVELSYLTYFSNLTALTINGDTISDLPDLSHLGHLKSINLSGCPVHSLRSLPAEIESLNLSHTDVGPSIGAVLSNSTRLKRLDLSGTKIDPLTLVDLRALSRLEHLDLRNTAITQSDIESLAAALADCEILVD